MFKDVPLFKDVLLRIRIIRSVALLYKIYGAVRCPSGSQWNIVERH